MNSSNLKYYNIDVLISKVKVNIPFRNNIIPKQKKVRILKMLLKKQVMKYIYFYTPKAAYDTVP